MRQDTGFAIYIRPELAESIFEEIALVCDSFDGDNENYNREDFVW